MTTAETPLGAIHAAAHQDGHRALLAATLRVAVQDASGGDLEAARWLASPDAANLLGYLIPDTSLMSAEQLQIALLNRLPAAVRKAVS